MKPLFNQSGLPMFEFLVDDSEESGVKCVSIVTDPAFGNSAIRFEKTKPKFIALGDKKQQIIAGFIILANVPVYRIDPEFGEYMGYFSPATIRKIVEKYHAEMLTNQVNLDHDNEAYIDAFMVEDYIVDSEARIADLKAKGIEHVNAMGSWYGAFKVRDPKVFEAIDNSGNATGFSVEAYLDKFMKEFNQDVKNKIISTKVNQKMKKINKTLKEKILSIFTEIEKLERCLVPELAFEIEWSEVGQPVNKIVVDENGNETMTPVGPGEFPCEEGIVVVDAQSNLVEVRELPAQPEVEVPEVEVEAPEVPVASGETSVSGSTETIAAIVDEQSGPAPSGSTETVVSGSTEIQTSGATKCGIEKSILEIVGTNDGEYTVLVKVQGGIVVEATAQSMVDLMLAKQTEIDALKLSVQTLEAKMKEPITDPILAPETPAVDFSKLSQYEKLMYKKGLKAV